MTYRHFVVAALLLLFADPAAWAQITQFDLAGKAGSGLLSGNENQTPAVVGGSGGEVGAGILFDAATSSLTINIAWGSGNGFTDLTGNANSAFGHIHGPTTNGGTASFTQNAGILIALDALPGWNASLTNGGFSTVTPITLTPENVDALFAGRLYINVHTSTFTGGEIRGNLVAVPEPRTWMLLAVGVLVMGTVARRRVRR